MFTRDVMVNTFVPTWPKKVRFGYRVWPCSALSFWVISLLSTWKDNRYADEIAHTVTPIAVLMFAFLERRNWRKSSGIVVMLGGGVWGIASMFVPQMVLGNQPIIGTFCVAVLCLITAIVDKRPANFEGVYGKSIEEVMPTPCGVGGRLSSSILE